MNRLYHSRYWRIYAAGLFVTLLTSWFSVGYYHPDEHFQVLEFAGYRLGLSPAADLPWEFREQIRPALQPTIACGVIAAARTAGIEDPFIHAFLLRLLTGLFAWYVVCRASLLLAGDFSTEKSRTLFVATNLLLWFVPYLSVRFSSETLAGVTFLFALCLILENPENRDRKFNPALAAAGLLLGFSFFLRFQMAFALLGVATWLLFIRKAGMRSVLILAFSGLLACVVSMAADYWFYGKFVLTPLKYFTVNIVQGRASDWGMMPWYYYFPESIIRIIPPMSLLLVPAFIAGIILKPRSLFTFAIIPFLAVHILVPHKEMRFLVPVLFPFLYLAWTAVDFAAGRVKNRTILKYTFGMLAGVNMIFLAYAVFFPAQEAMKYYKFIYDYNGPGKQHILSEKTSVYSLVGLEVNFYKAKGTQVVVLGEKDTIEACLRSANTGSALLVSRKMTLQNPPGNCKTDLLYCVLPGWLRQFNFNNWQNRSRVWCIYRATVVPAD
jgi:phosphatidylinositol glycan class B